MKPIFTVGILVYGKNDNILLVEHKSTADHKTGIFGLPAGRLNKNESAIEAAVRELKEETGLTTKKEDLIDSNQEYTATIERKNETKTFTLIFLCL